MPRRQPWVWKPLKFPILIFPKSRAGFKALVERIFNRYGPGRYIIYRVQFEGEKPMFRPVIYIEIRGDCRYRIIKRYSQFRAVKGRQADQPWFKQHRKRLLITVDVRERLRARRRNLLNALQHKVELQQPFQHEIRTGTGLWVYKTKR